MKPPVGTSFAASMASLGVAACCVLPMTMMLLGLGGSWIAVFGKVSAASYYVLTISTGLLFVAWYIAYRRGSLVRLKWWLGLSTALTAVAWLIATNEDLINDFLITLM